MSTTAKTIPPSPKQGRPKRKRRRNRNKNKNKNANKTAIIDAKKQQHVGDIVDVMVHQRWYIGVIKYINNSNIDIEITDFVYYYNGGVVENNQTITMNRKNKSYMNRIKPLNSETIQLHKLNAQLPEIPNIKKMVYYKARHDNHKGYIIICSRPYFKNYIYFYDILNDEYIKKYKYPSKIKCKPGSTFHIAINKHNNSLYFVISDYNDYPHIESFYALNLITDEWSVLNMNAVSETTKISSICIANNHLYILSGHYLLQYNLDTNTLKKRLILSSYRSKRKACESSMNYIENHDKLYILLHDIQYVHEGGYGHHFEFLIHEIGTKKIRKLNVEKIVNELRWKNTLTMNPGHIFYAYNHLVFIFNIYCHRFVIYDYISNQWYIKKTQIVFNKKLHTFNDNECLCIGTDDDQQVHCFENDDHFIVSLYDFIPNKLVGVGRKYYGKLISGFIRNRIENNYNINITNDIQNIIMQLFPIFS